MICCALSVFLLQGGVPQAKPVTAVRDPAYAADGRLAVSVRGDLWTVTRAGAWNRVTTGRDWDREPAWAADGRSIVYSSNHGGTFHIWRIPVGDSGAVGEAVRVTASGEMEREPSVAVDGRIAFARGKGSEARIWTRGLDGTEGRLTTGTTAERWPAFSPDGRRIAYVAVTETSRRLLVRMLDSAAGARSVDTVSSLAGIEHPSWSPDGRRLTFSVGGQRPAVFIAPVDGRYANVVALRHARSAWSPDGRVIALADLPEDDVGYNGDPERLAGGDREAHDLLGAVGGLTSVVAPAPVDSARASDPGVNAPLSTALLREEFNGAAFDEAWQRTLDLYYATGPASDRRARWQALRDRYRPRALAARTEDELRVVIHEMLRERPPFRMAASGRAAVSSAHPVATAAGLEILARGGNVVDAAAAVSFALGVVEPDASGVGGYGEMVIATRALAEPQLIEFMSRVPEDAALSNGDLLQNGRLPDDGPVLANVPGTVAAMHLAWRRFGSGKVQWADILAPAVRAARDGYVISDGLATTLETEREHFLKYEGSRALFFRDGKPLRAGDTIRNPDLAWTLEQIAKGGADAFYKGEIARRLVSDLRGKGNAIKSTDMSRYFAVVRDPVASTYRGYSLYSSAPPVAGGAQIAAMLNMLELHPDPRPYPEDAATLHAMLSAWLLAPSSRNRIADPGLWPVTVEPFTSKDTARARWRCFDPNHAPTARLFRGDTLMCPAKGAADDREEAHHSSGTTSFTIADGDGNVVAVTQTLGTWGGNFYVTPGLGFLYNDKLGSYASDPGAYGARIPFARHGSTLSPTIVFEGTGAKRRALLAVGAAGNTWITSAVYEMLVGMLDFKLDPQAALEQPRFLPFLSGADRPPTVLIEDGLAPAVERRLEALGYRLQRVSLIGELREGYGAAVLIRDGKAIAGADPRRSGTAGAIP